MTERKLANFTLESVVSQTTRTGYVRVTIHAGDGSTFVGRMTPDECRVNALTWMQAAEAADHDALVWVALTQDVGLPERTAAGFIFDLRARREGGTDEVVGQDP